MNIARLGFTTALSLGLLIQPFKAGAEVKRIGTFVPRECGKNPKVDRAPAAGGRLLIREICLGELAHLNQAALQISLNNGAALTYEIEFGAPKLSNRGEVTAFTGQFRDAQTEEPMPTMDDEIVVGEVKVLTTSQSRAKRRLTVQSPGLDLGASVDLETVFTTMGSPLLR